MTSGPCAPSSGSSPCSRALTRPPRSTCPRTRRSCSWSAPRTRPTARPWSSRTTATAATAHASPSRLPPMCPRTSELASLIGSPLGDLEPLDGGITNRNFRVRTAEGDFVVREFGDKTSALGIDRRAERAATEAAARVGVGPEVVAFTDELLVTTFIDGEPMPQVRIEETAAARRAVHRGPARPTTFSGVAVAEDYARQAGERPSELAIGHEIEAALHGPEHDPVPCHNDLLNA